MSQINADLAERVVIDTNALDWQPSPSPSVWRKRLYLDGPVEDGAGPFPHDHPHGEEVFVLDGADEDEHGVYPARTWIRNPPGSCHAPRSRDGAVLPVWQPPR